MMGPPPEPKKWAIATAFEGTIDINEADKYWTSMNFVQVADDSSKVTSWVVQITYECCMVEMPLAVFKVWREMLMASKLPPGTG